MIYTLRTGAAIALMAGRASIWRRCGTRCAPKRRTNPMRNSLNRAAIRIASSSPESFPEPDIMIITKPLIWASASCSLYSSNAKDRLKLCIWNLSDGLLSRYHISNSSSPVLLFSLHQVHCVLVDMVSFCPSLLMPSLLVGQLK